MSSYTFQTDDALEAKRCLQSNDLHIAVWSFLQDLRGWIKHENDFGTVDCALENVRDQLYDRLQDVGIDINGSVE